MQLITKKTHSSGQRSQSPQLNVSITGAFTLNRVMAQKMELQDRDQVIFSLEDDSYFIAKASSNGFIVRDHNKGNGSLMFNCKSLVMEMITAYDLAIGPDKKNSVRLDMDYDNPVEFADYTFYKID